MESRLKSLSIKLGDLYNALDRCFLTAGAADVFLIQEIGTTEIKRLTEGKIDKLLRELKHRKRVRVTDT